MADLETPSYSGRRWLTPLQLAIESDDADEVRRLVGSGADVDNPSRLGIAPLPFAMSLVRRSTVVTSEAILRVLVDAGCRVSREAALEMDELYTSRGGRMYSDEARTFVRAAAGLPPVGAAE